MENSISKVNQGINGIMTPEIPLLPESVAGVGQPVVCLNDRGGEGKWEFNKKPVEGIPELDAADRDYDFSALDGPEWVPVIVPGELEMQGFELKNNTEYYYRTTVHIPLDFKGCKCMLWFDGVYSNARVWVGGRYVRSHQGGFTTWDCDITEYVTPGEGVQLVVGIADLEGDEPGLYNHYERRTLRDPSFASNYAHHNIGGILRDVSLAALPGTYIARLHTDVAFDENFRDARLQVGVQVNSGEHDVTINYTLLDEDGKVCLTAARLISGDGSRREDTCVLQVAEPMHWDAEHPYLYTLQAVLSANGQTQAVYREKIGFREIYFSGKKGSDGNKVYVNGYQVKLRGTCRHDVDFRLGRSTTREQDWEEIRAYKAANINHVRTSHYPASRHFLEACDALGMYVEQENAACFQGGVNGIAVCCAPEDFVGEFTEMVERDRNHPSILMWSLGNESGFEDTEGYRREFDYIKAVDDSRPVIFSYPFTVSSLPCPYDIYSMHYMDVDAPMGLDDIPVLHDEYMHIACYNLEELRRDPNVSNFWGRSIQKAWDRIFDTDGTLGGDLWGGIDDIFHLPGNVKEKWQHHSGGKAAGYGSWGSVLDVHKRLKPEAYLTKKAYTPVKVDEKNVIFRDGKILIPVKNRFDHTNLNELTLVCKKQGEVYRESVLENIPPHASGILQPECAAPGEGEALYLQFFKGTELIDEFLIEARGGFCGRKSMAAGICETEGKEACGRGGKARTACGEPAPAEYMETEKELVVTAGQSRFCFDKDTACMAMAQYQGKALLCGGPHLVLTGAVLGEWKKEGPGVRVQQRGSQVLVTLTGKYSNGYRVWYTITIDGDGRFITSYQVKGGGTDKTIREFGVRYDLVPGAEKVSWLRKGQYSCYPEDHIGRNSGTAYRRNEKASACGYGAVPEWGWKEDMWDDFLYGREDRENGLVTKDFKALRENIEYFDIHFADSQQYVRAEDSNAQTAARVSVSVDENGEERAALLVIKRWIYPDLGWGNDEKRRFWIGAGAYGSAVIRFGSAR